MEEKNKCVPVALYYSIASSIFLIFIIAFRWYLADGIFSAFAVVLFMLIFLLMFLISLILNIVHIIRRVRRGNFKTFVPLAINVITILIIQFIPLTNAAVAWDFTTNLRGREEVVSMIKTGELGFNKQLVSLPKEYAHLSQGGGEIIVEKEGEKLKVFFFTFRGMLSDYNGFIYVSDDSQIQSSDSRMVFLKVIRLKENWYWVESE